MAPEPADWPRLSVIVPACNAVDTLPDAADRLLAMDTTDDLALGLMLKRSGARGRVLWATNCVAVRWYTSLREMIVGLDKNTYPRAGCRLWCLMLMALAVCLPLGAWMARWARRPVLPDLAIPVGAALMAYIMLHAGIVGARRGGIYRHGTFYSSALLRRGARVSMF